MKGESEFGWDRIHADFPSGAPTFELHHAGHPREQSVILAEIDIEPGEKLGAALADNDAAGLDGFTAIGLHAQILGITIPTIT